MATETCKFQIMSDLHLETHPSYDYDFARTAPYLALLGDIGHIATNGLFEFLRRQLQRYKSVFYLIGNHEPWHLSMEHAKKRMHDFVAEAKRLQQTKSYGEFIFLDQTSYDLNDKLTILGCTLYSRILPGQARAVATRSVDFRDILQWDIGEHVDAHIEDLQWLNQQVVHAADKGKNIIIFTHYNPTTDPRANNPRYKHSEVTSGFVTDLSAEECWKNEAVIFWAFGHTHYNCDFVSGTKRVVANQKGYWIHPQETFRSETVFEIPSATES